jgi:hypothetical protein
VLACHTAVPEVVREAGDRVFDALAELPSSMTRAKVFLDWIQMVRASILVLFLVLDRPHCIHRYQIKETSTLKNLDMKLPYSF